MTPLNIGSSILNTPVFSTMAFELSKLCETKNIDDIKLKIKDVGVNSETLKQYNQVLYQACKAGRLDVINFLIDQGADDWDSGFSGACEGGHANIAKLMIEKGSKLCKNINNIGSEANDFGIGGPRFSKLCETGSISDIKSKIKDIGIIDTKTKHKSVNFRILHYYNWGLYGACKAGRSDVIDLLIEQGANDWHNGLLGACEGGHLDIVKLMIEKGSKIDGLYDACRHGRLDIIDYLISRGDRNFDGGLLGACEGGRLEIAKSMINNGAKNFNAAMEGACQEGHSDLVDLTIENGANNWEEGLKGACERRHSKIIKLMIKNGADKWRWIFDIVPDVIDSGIVDLVIEKKVPLENYLKYPKDAVPVFNLLDSGLGIDNFKNIEGFDDLVKEVEKRREKKTDTEKEVLSKRLMENLMGPDC